MTTSIPVGNQFVWPDKTKMDTPANMAALERFLNTQIVNRIQGVISSQPVLGRPGTGLIEAFSGSVAEIESSTLTVTDPTGPIVHIEQTRPAALSGSGETSPSGDLVAGGNFGITGGLTVDVNLVVGGTISSTVLEDNSATGITIAENGSGDILIGTASGTISIAAGSTGTVTVSGAKVTVADSGQALAFFSQPGSARITVTGAKGGNAALGSLMSALSIYGLIIDSTSA